MRKLKFFMILFSLLLIPLVAHSETTYTSVIDDNDKDGTINAYWGGQVVNASPTYYGDVIGSPYFSVDQMVVVQTGNLWTVTITGPYFNYRKDQNANGGLPYLLGPGDLYISSTGWYATQNDLNYSTDTFTDTENWDYVVPITATGAASSGLYALDFDDITMTNVGSLTGNYRYRTNQAWQGGAMGSSLGSASSQFISASSPSDYDSLIFTFNASALDFTSGSVGFHWTMQCGNDVLEGQVPARDVPVPEPSTLLLLGLGLTGVVAYKKIRS